MNRIRVIKLSALFALVSTLLTSLIFHSVVLAQTRVQTPVQKITVAIISWPPYTANNLPQKGIASVLVKHILERAGYQVDIVHDNWNRVLKGADIGVYDVIATIWKTDERAQQFIFSAPYLYNKIYFYQRQGSTYKYEKLSDLNNLLIGTIDGYAYSKAFTRNKNIIRIPANRLTQNFLTLLGGKLDLVVADQYLAKYELQRYLGSNADKIKQLEKPLVIRGNRIAVSKQHKHAKEIIARFNHALATMQKDGSLEKIRTAYIEQLLHFVKEVQ